MSPGAAAGTRFKAAALRKLRPRIADSESMEPGHEVIALDADRMYYKNWSLDLRSSECYAAGPWDEIDWRTTFAACTIVLISNN